MNIPGSSLVNWLRTVAIIQFVIVGLNLTLVHLFGLNDRMACWPAAVREMFLVHFLGLCLMVLTISVLTLKFAPKMGSGTCAICRWLAGAAALFWLLRGLLQLSYGLSSPWPLNQLHWALMAVNGFLALVYGGAAWGGSETD